MPARGRGMLAAIGASAIGALRHALSRTPRPAERRGSPRTFEAGNFGQFGDGATRELRRSEVARLRPSYDPHPDGDPDPGEIVWTWVPYAENDGRGKDRPVLIIARLSDAAVAGCYLSTKAHPGYVSVGTGGWDSAGRESFLNPERVLRVTNDGMRREGHVLAQADYRWAVERIAALHGFSA